MQAIKRTFTKKMAGKSEAEKAVIAAEQEKMIQAEKNKEEYQKSVDAIVHPLNDKKAGKTGFLFKQVGKHARPGSLMCGGFLALTILGAAMALLGFLLVNILFAMMEPEPLVRTANVNFWAYILLGYGLATMLF